MVLISFIWFSVVLAGWGISFALAIIPGSIYTNGYINAAANIFSYFFINPMANRIGRKVSLIITLFMGGVGFLLYQPLSTLGEIPTYVCMTVGVFGSVCALNFVYLVTTESFPTVYRGTAFGFGSLWARVGGIVAPLLVQIAQNSLMYIFGGMCMVSGVFSFFLKETKD